MGREHVVTVLPHLFNVLLKNELEAVLNGYLFGCVPLPFLSALHPFLRMNVKPYVRSSGVSYVGGRGKSPPGKLNVKTGPPSADISILGIRFVFCRLFFLRFSGYFRFLANIDIHDIRIRYHFLTFLLSVGSWPLWWPVAPLQLRFAHPGSNL